ncbi:MAG TPA: LPS assembly lipoprotein LptE [Xanthomonadaceae bacterium]|nr:LPS assembly lipoprotein LptE [Xanthomonadaceae bacterium]
MPASQAFPLRTLFLIGLCLAVAACGFRLRGEVALPAGFERLHLEVANPGNALRNDLAAALGRAGAQLVANPEQASARIRIPVNQMRTEVLTVGAGARIREFEIRYRVELEVLDAEGESRMARQIIELARDYTFDERAALGAEQEAEVLRGELQREMLQQVLRRLERTP